MYPTHLMSTVQSGKREANVKMKRASSLVMKQLDNILTEEGRDHLRPQMGAS